MLLPVTYPSAAEFWLDGSHRKNLEALALGAPRGVDLPEDFSLTVCAQDAQALTAALGLASPVHLLSRKPADRGRWASHHTHVLSTHIPEESFIDLGRAGLAADLDSEIYMASPEFTFLEAARFLSFEDLMVLGTELCAGYTYDSGRNYGQRKRSPLCSSVSVREYIERSKGAHGALKAGRAARFIMDSSGSPVETRLAILAILPAHLGGYGLPRPVLNGDIILNEEGQKVLGYVSMRCDMVWELYRIVVEYDSKLSHSSAPSIGTDIRRYNALTLSGYKYYRISSDIYNDFGELDTLYTVLRREMGLPVGARFAAYADRRKQLYDCLKASKVFSGFRMR